MPASWGTGWQLSGEGNSATCGTTDDKSMVYRAAYSHPASARK